MVMLRRPWFDSIYKAEYTMRSFVSSLGHLITKQRLHVNVYLLHLNWIGQPKLIGH